jgi:hypothetical protein
MIKPVDAEMPVLQTKSDNLGAFQFRGLKPGKWMVWQQTPSDWDGVTATQFEVTVPEDPTCVNVRFKNRSSAP